MAELLQELKSDLVTLLVHDLHILNELLICTDLTHQSTSCYMPKTCYDWRIWTILFFVPSSFCLSPPQSCRGTSHRRAARSSSTGRTTIVGKRRHRGANWILWPYPCYAKFWPAVQVDASRWRRFSTTNGATCSLLSMVRNVSHQSRVSRVFPCWTPVLHTPLLRYLVTLNHLLLCIPWGSLCACAACAAQPTTSCIRDPDRDRDREWSVIAGIRWTPHCRCFGALAVW